MTSSANWTLRPTGHKWAVNTPDPVYIKDLKAARLIAAAPELLASLNAVMDQLTHEGYVNQSTGTRALNAIAKAEGRA